LEQGEREKIESTQKGSQARLTAINAALKQEESLNLQDTSFYRELQNQRAEVTQQALEEQNKLTAEAGKASAESQQKIAELQLSAFKANVAMQDSARHMSSQQKIAEETSFENISFQIKAQAAAREIAALDKSGKDYQNQLKSLQDKEKQMVQEHENEVSAIRERAEEQSNQRILSANQRFNDQIAHGLTSAIMGHESWAKAVTSLGDQVVTGMIQNAIKSMLADDMTKERDAAAAARKAYNIGISMGGPAGMVLGPTFAAVTFAAQMAFAEGTDSVPGVGRGDVVSAKLTPGEGVVPGGVMDGLRSMARAGTLGGGGGSTNHVHFHVVNHVNTIDGDGMKDVLDKHSDQLTKHFHNVVRKMNK
jgi:hypothetical protein